MSDDPPTPERPRAEPEIIPPDRSRQPRPARSTHSYDGMGGTGRVYVGRIGPLGAAFLFLVIAVIVAVIVLAFIGALLIWIPLVAIILVVGAVSGLMRARRW